MRTTIETVTIGQLRRLETEAAIAGDSLMMELCGLAMGALGENRDNERCQAALIECVRVISDAETQL